MTHEASARLVIASAVASDKNGRARVQLFPMGRMKPRDQRLPWVLNDPAAVIAASQAQIERGMPVDLDHAMDLHREAPAAGWITKLEAASDGIWADIEWTPLGRSKVEGREYRYISPVFIHDQSNGNILRIERAGLTNTPALEMRAICSEGIDMPDDNSDLTAFVALLRDALGLQQGSTAADLLSAVRDLVGDQSKKRDTKTEMMESMASAVFDNWSQNRERENKQRVLAAIENAKLPPALHDWGLAMCRESPALFDDFVKTTPGFTHLIGRDPAMQRMAEQRATVSTQRTDNKSVWPSSACSTTDLQTNTGG